MRVKLISMKFENFKGAKPTEIDFSDNTTISADNGIGKTRILDAWLWLLFGKDSQGKTDFEIKSTRQPNLDVEETAVIECDGTRTELMKVLKEKYAKKKGEPETFRGNENFFYLDGMNVIKRKFDEFVASIINQDTFKFISDPFYFESMHWEVRRKVLISLVPSVTDQDIASKNKKFADFLEKLSGKDVMEYQKHLASTRRRMQEDINKIPSEIKGVQMTIPENLDFEIIRQNLEQKQTQLKTVEEGLKNEFEAWNQKNRERNDYIVEMVKAENKVDELVTNIQREFARKNKDVEFSKLSKDTEINQLQKLIEFNLSTLKQKSDFVITKNYEIEQVRKQWYTENEKEFILSDDQKICPTCKRELDNIEELADELRTNFNRDKRNKLDGINEKGKSLKAEVDHLQEEIEDLKNANNEYKSKITFIKNQLEQPGDEKSLQEVIDSNQELVKAIKDLKQKRDNLPKEVERVCSAELEAKKNAIVNSIDELKSQLRIESQINIARQTIKDLEAKMARKSQELAEIERIELIADKFIEEKMNALESLINAKFKYCQFKLFEKQVNGEVKPACITIINEVPYNSANYASRVNAGLDVIRTLSEFYNTWVPIFIDNRESVSEIIPMDTQIINLIKVKGQNELLIEKQS